ncbi:MAG: sulfite exporter TauE/SafE family protein [Bacteroidota bacterium]|nr:sulfite exporter TauE/SafE family protein [Bacteroidota bacterium]
MEIIAYLASIFIGISLGLIGGGGSMLTVPLLVYLFSMEAISATAHSFFIVGITSAVGSITYFTKGLVRLKTALLFGLPSILAVYITRAFIVPAIPDEIFHMGDLSITKNLFILLLFALLMIGASYSMIKKNLIHFEAENETQQINYSKFFMIGTVVGFLNGLLGVGGGFLIIPALVLLSRIPMKEAIGTTLVIIAANSFIGFIGVNPDTFIDWMLLVKISTFAITGMFIGIFLSKKIDGAKLKPAFGWFILFMGIYIIIKETLFK